MVKAQNKAVKKTTKTAQKKIVKKTSQNKVMKKTNISVKKASLDPPKTSAQSSAKKPKNKGKPVGLGAHPLLGVFIALFAAISLGLAPTLIKRAYLDGAGLLFAIFCRGIMPVIVLFLFAIFSKKSFNIKKIPKAALFMISFSISMTALFYMSAILFISPGLAVVLLYIFPIIVLFVVSVQNQKMPSLLTMLAYFLALLGIILVIGPNFQNLDIRGVLLALGAGCTASIMFFVGHVAGPDAKPSALIFFGSSVLTIIALILMLVLDRFQMPQSLVGWEYLSMGTFFYSCGMILVLIAVNYLRADLASLAMNIEPFVGALTVYFVLGDTMSGLQIFGIIIVVFAISWGGILAHREALEPEDMIAFEHS